MTRLGYDVIFDNSSPLITVVKNRENRSLFDKVMYESWGLTFP